MTTPLSLKKLAINSKKLYLRRTLLIPKDNLLEIYLSQKMAIPPKILRVTEINLDPGTTQRSTNATVAMALTLGMEATTKLMKNVKSTLLLSIAGLAKLISEMLSRNLERSCTFNSRTNLVS
jgi:hypothetical protein